MEKTKRKFIITAEMRDLEMQVDLAEISYSRMIEMLCEKADRYAKEYHETELKKMRVDDVIKSVCKNIHCVDGIVGENSLGENIYCHKCRD